MLGMWSQPYDLNIYEAHTGAGVTKDRPAYKQGLFYAMYYGSGQWVRKEAGEEATFRMEELEVVTNMTEDSYKPLVTWDIHQVRMSSLTGRHNLPLAKYGLVHKEGRVRKLIL